MAPTPASPVKKAKFKHSTPRKRNRIHSLFSIGLKAKAIALKEGVSTAHVYGVVRRFSAQDYGVSRPGRGRPRKLTERDRRVILREIAKDPFIQIETLRRLACPHVGRTCLSNYLKEEGISHTLAATRPYISEDHAAGRYAFAIEHADKEASFWRTVLFTDESTVDRGGVGKRAWVFRPKGKIPAPQRVPTTRDFSCNI